TALPPPLWAPAPPPKILMKPLGPEPSLSVPDKDGALGGLAGKAQDLTSRARQAVTGVPTGALEKSMVDDQFEDVRKFVGADGAGGAAGAAGGGPTPIDGIIQLLSEAYQWLVATDQALKTGQSLPPTDIATKLNGEAARQPEPMRSMLASLAGGSVKATVGKTRERIDAELRAQVTEFCQRATAGRYPFVRTSNQDVTPEDFAKLFAQGGVLDGFFQRALAPVLDTGPKPWRFKDPAMGQSSALAEFQRAQVIREVLFRGGGSMPSLQLELKPVEMDASIQQFTLDVDGKLVKYSHGPQVAVPVQFPGPGGRSLVRATISPAPASGSSGPTL